MQIGSKEMGTDWGPWVQWQRTVFQVSFHADHNLKETANIFKISAAHKVGAGMGSSGQLTNPAQIILTHRPILGSAFRGDQRFASSLQASRVSRSH